MEVDTAIRRMLLGFDDVKGQVQDKVFKNRLEVGIEGTGGAAIVVSEQPWWATPDPVQTHEWPVVWVDCYADATRDSSGMVRKYDSLDKAKALARVVDKHMHGVRGVVWGEVGNTDGLTVVSCQRWGRRYLPAAAGKRASTGSNEAYSSDPLAYDNTVMIARMMWALDVVHDG